MCAAENIIENVNCALTDEQSESIFYLNSEDFRPLPQVILINSGLQKIAFTDN